MEKAPSLTEQDLKRMAARMRDMIAKRLGQLKDIEQQAEKDLADVRSYGDQADVKDVERQVEKDLADVKETIKSYEDQAKKWKDR